MKIIIKNCNDLRFHKPGCLEESNWSFQVPSKNQSSIQVSIDFKNQKIEALKYYDISDELLHFLQTNCKTDNSSDIDPFENENLKKIINELEYSTKTVVSLIKYCLKNKSINDNQVFRARMFWTIDGNEWYKIPNTAYAWSDTGGGTQLNSTSAGKIQEYLYNGFTPFLALKFLHRADIEENSQVKWIEAAAAAEIAIKEFLLKKDPERYRHLKSKQSPPISDLYGSILKKYTGENSPKLDELIEGARKRNMIIHSPDEISITRKEANNYVHDVDEAIHYLLSHLYPDDGLINQSYLLSKMRVYSEEEMLAKINSDMHKK